MKIFISLLSSLLFLSCISGRIDTSQYPKYNGEKDVYGFNQSDLNFISRAAQGKTRYEASQEFVQLGWQYFKSGDIQTAIRRFNQAWLLDSTNCKINRGFGVYLGESKLGSFDEVMHYLLLAVKCDSTDNRLFGDIGVTYGIEAAKRIKDFGKDSLWNVYYKTAQKYFNKMEVKNVNNLDMYLYWAKNCIYNREKKDASAVFKILNARMDELDFENNVDKEVYKSFMIQYFFWLRQTFDD